ncbi:hypothetical protein BT67DRAFT_33810 [Trichocladium antarcticum]|uniref:Uncharacterized protein n=1 Tax=Trichocladium antarcticum TaxID=1450529 RepID=A0AAN6ZCD3_9PEZI|nr:hypothetical protein BT67DRAFT_33810 [Trichocladium antarcticum]
MSSSSLWPRAQTTNQIPGPPYPPPNATVGGRPTPTPDIALSATFIALFALAGATHVCTFWHNRLRRGRLFPFSLLLAGFCTTRIAALAMRVAWARHPADVDLAIASMVLTSAGVLIVFAVNLFLTVRVVRAVWPRVGWSGPVWWGLRVVVGTVVAVLVMVVVCSVHTLFTLDEEVRRKERQVTLFAGVYMSCLAAVPWVVMGLLAVVGRKGDYWQQREDFGAGRMRTKIGLLVGASLLLTLGAGFRCGASFAIRPVADPAWYHSRGAFYGFNFAIELVVVYTYAIMRFDRMFHVPPGSAGPGDYSRDRLDGMADSGDSSRPRSREKEPGSGDSGV